MKKDAGEATVEEKSLHCWGGERAHWGKVNRCNINWTLTSYKSIARKQNGQIHVIKHVGSSCPFLLPPASKHFLIFKLDLLCL